MATRIALLSDLHLEFYSDKHISSGGGPIKHSDALEINEQADAVVLAGDIHTGIAGIQWAQWAFPELQVLYVMGNHEFYSREVNETFRQCRTQVMGSNVHLLEQEEVEIQGVRFLGTTLWTDFLANGSYEESKKAVGEGLNDFGDRGEGFGKIRNGSRPFRTDDAEQWHYQARRWLAERLEEGPPAVVVTHHGPHMEAQPPQFRGGRLAPGFTSDLTPLMGAQAPLWICGHTHYCCDFEIDGTRIVANQAGYPHEPVDGFDPLRIVEV